MRASFRPPNAGRNGTGPTLKAWLPYLRAGSGVDIFTRRMARALGRLGVSVHVQAFPQALQNMPWLLAAVPPPPGVDLVLANSWHGFAFARPGIALVTVNHLCVADPALAPYRNRHQAFFHRRLVTAFEARSYRAAAAVVAVSDYTAEQVRRHCPELEVITVANGVDTDFLRPGDADGGDRADGLDLLFVGNLSRRKGADLLPRIMRRLGPRYRLFYASLRAGERLPPAPNLHPLGCLDESRLRDAYRRADLVLFPTRLEGLPYVVLEGMACGKPVVASRVASLPELIAHNETGVLCPIDDVDAFASAVERLQRDPERRRKIGIAARRTIVARFPESLMAERYPRLFETVLAQRP